MNRCSGFSPGGLLIIAILLLPVLSCRNEANTSRIKTLDSLMIVLDTLENKIFSITYDDIDLFYGITVSSLDSVKRKSRNGNLSREEINTLSVYTGLKKSFQNYRLFHRRFTEELEYSRSQLKNLRHDIEKNLIDEEVVIAHLQKEINAVKQFESVVNPSVTSMAENVKKFREYSPDMNKLISNLYGADSSGCK